MKIRLCLGVSLVGLVIACAIAAEPTTAPSVVQAPSPQPVLTDEQVGASIQRAASFLLTKFDPHGNLIAINGTTSQVDHDDLQALCVYALLQAGLATDDPRLTLRGGHINALIDQLKRCPLKTDPKQQTPVTYARSLRAAALSAYDRPEDRYTLRDDVNWLLHAHREGGYTYDDNWPNLPPTYEVRVIASSGIPAYTTAPGVYTGIRGIPTGVTSGGIVSSGDRIDHCIPSRPRAIVQSSRQGVAKSQGGSVSRQVVATPPPAKAPAQPTGPNTARATASAAGSPGAPGTVGPVRSSPGTGLPAGVSGVGMGTDQPPNNIQYVPVPSPLPWDNSNSQFGAFGVYCAAQAGIDVPNTYWQAVDRHWAQCQLDDGRWGYSIGDTEPSQSMTCAGLASFYVTLDRLSANGSMKLGNPALTPAMAKPMDWLCDTDNSTTMLGPLTRYVSYNLFTLERVGLDGGYKYFGNHDWYRELAARVMSVQWPNGAFGRNVDGYDTVVETAFTLAFLSRGRSPVMMEKLQLAGDWNNRPRDLANATRFASRALERPLNWEVVPLNRDWTDWLDSPLMYIASDQPANFNDADIAKLHNYINAGGTIFTHADGGREAFTDYVIRTLVPKLFPHDEMIPIPADDPIYSAQYQLAPKIAATTTATTAPTNASMNPLPLRGVRDGSRWLLVHSSADLAGTWQTRSEKGFPHNFELATNLYVYAAGKNNLRNRIAPMVAGPTTAPTTKPD